MQIILNFRYIRLTKVKQKSSDLKEHVWLFIDHKHIFFFNIYL